jgi:hypothetical protein
MDKKVISIINSCQESDIKNIIGKPNIHIKVILLKKIKSNLKILFSKVFFHLKEPIRVLEYVEM